MPIGLNSLLLENTNTSSVMDNDIEVCSFTNSMIGFLTEMNSDFRKANKEYYKAIYESENLVAVNESFADFFEKIKEIIKKFLKYLKSLLDRFITTLHRMVGSEKHLLNSEDTLKKFNSDHEFDYDGYKFTIEPNIPVCNALVEFNNAFINIKFDDLASTDENKKDKKKIIKDVYTKLKQELDGDKYDIIRAQVIGRDKEMIYESEYNNELFELFRDGSDSTSVFTVTNNVVMDCFKSIKDYKSVEKDVLAKKKEMENQYNTINKQLDHFMSANRNNSIYTLDIDSSIYNGDQIKLDNDAMNQLNLYIKALSDQVSKMTTIHGTAFSYKLDALKDKYTQDKRILYIALNKIQKDKKLRVGDM